MFIHEGKDKYDELHKIYKEKYGDEILILMQYGNFYEIFNTRNNVEYMTNLCQVLCMYFSDNHIGFPCLSLEKYKSLLVNAGYCVVIVDENRQDHTNIKYEFKGMYVKEDI